MFSRSRLFVGGEGSQLRMVLKQAADATLMKTGLRHYCALVDDLFARPNDPQMNSLSVLRHHLPPPLPAPLTNHPFSLFFFLALPSQLFLPSGFSNQLDEVHFAVADADATTSTMVGVGLKCSNRQPLATCQQTSSASAAQAITSTW